MDATAFLTIALGVLMALAAAGGVVFIKLSRRRHPSHGSVGEAVPARPLSRGQARRLERNYLRAVKIAVAALLVLAVLLLFGGSLQ